MDKTFLAAGAFAFWALAALPVAAQPQAQTAATPSPAGCHVEVLKLMGDPPDGIGELGTAIRELDAKLRPQVEEVNTLKAEIARLEARQQREAQGARTAGAVAVEGFDEEPPQPAAALGPDSVEVRLAQARAELETKHDRLKHDYSEQQRLLVGPVQARVSERAQAFATAQGCGALKMARTPDLAGLASAGSRNVTGEFVAWYLANRT